MTDFRFDVPSHHKSIIKVIGVGGGGSNAVGYMYTQGIQDVDFIVCNTDYQALETNPVKEKLQIGSNLTEGLGAGARPEVGKNAAKESKEEIRKLLSKDTKMLFITAGMGGGTGTGAAPIIAEIAKELGILTVGIVTMPFGFEGKRKRNYAEEGVAELKKYCDTVLVILNERLKDIYGEYDMDQAFSKADDILTNAARSIAQIITLRAKVNVDFEDVRTVLKNSGQTVMGSAMAIGSNRALEAVENALNSPLLNNRDITGAQRVLLSITYSEDSKMKLNEFTTITSYIEDMIGEESEEVIWGEGIDNNLQPGELRVTIIATGFVEDGAAEFSPLTNLIEKRIFVPERIETVTLEPTEELRKVLNLEDNQYGNQHLKPEQAAQALPNNIEWDMTSSQLIKLSLDDDAPINPSAIQQPIAISVKETESKLNDIKERIKRIQEASKLRGESFEDSGYQAFFNEPAYLRRNKQITNTQVSSDSNLSRYSLSDDDEIVGNNRFFDDNVD